MLYSWTPTVGEMHLQAQNIFDLVFLSSKQIWVYKAENAKSSLEEVDRLFANGKGWSKIIGVI